MVAVSVHLAMLVVLSGSTGNLGLTPQYVALLSHADVSSRLQARGGQHLVFVRYDPDVPIDVEWVYNSADLHTAPVLFAQDLGTARNPDLIAAFPGRSVWLVTVSTAGSKLDPYETIPVRQPSHR